jgi:quinol monooxygenase YgiN
MLILAVTIRCKPEKAEAARQFFATFTEKARSEPGCVHYEFFQGRDEPATFFVFEKWSSQADFDTHCQTDYVKRFHERFDELLVKPKNELLYLKPL